MADLHTLHAAFAARIDAVLNALEMEGVLLTMYDDRTNLDVVSSL